MKNSLLAFNIALAVAIAVLFYFQFASKNNLVSAANSFHKNENGFKIAYFEMDSVENQYEYLKDVRNTLRQMEQQKSSELAELRNQNKVKLQAYQKKGSNMTQEEIARANDELMQLENELKTQEQIKMGELQDESIKKMQQAKMKIEDFLKLYNKDKNYAYILSSSSNIIYYKDTTYNITADLISGLNAAYNKNK
jgi:outer membrane protein